MTDREDIDLVAPERIAELIRKKIVHPEVQGCHPEYRWQVQALVDDFTYELCSMCGLDLDDHFIAPRFFGHATLICLRLEDA